MRKILLSILAYTLFTSLTALNAQVSEDSIIYKEIMWGDSIIFEESFNKCNVVALYMVTDEDFEFYHDQGGVQVGQKQFILTTYKNICGLEYRPIRKLIEGSTKIFPLYNNGELYGAIQEGVHAFYAQEKDVAPYLTSVARFTHLWIKKDNRWIIRRVLSYDHKSPDQVKNIPKILN